PAANTIASAPATAASTASSLADSRSHSTGTAPVCPTSSACAGLRISERTRTPCAVSRRARRIAIFPCPPAIRTTMSAEYGRSALGRASCEPGFEQTAQEALGLGALRLPEDLPGRARLEDAALVEEADRIGHL